MKKMIGKRILEAADAPFNSLTDIMQFGRAVLQDYVNGDLSKQGAKDVLVIREMAILDPLKLVIEQRATAGLSVCKLLGTTESEREDNKTLIAQEEYAMIEAYDRSESR